MSTPAPQPAFSARGAVDLSALARPKAPPPGEPGGAQASGGFVVDVTEETFQTIMEGSAQYPVIVLLWMPTDKANADVGTTLGKLADEFAGRFLLARINAQEQPRLVQAFGIQGVPSVVAVIGGQPAPLFAGAATEDQIRSVLDQVLAAAEQAGLTGRAAPVGATPDDDEVSEEPAEEALPPLHQEAFDAIERGDFDAAAAAYTLAHKQDPSDAFAVAGLATVKMMARNAGADPAAVLAAADAAAAAVAGGAGAGDGAAGDGGNAAGGGGAAGADGLKVGAPNADALSAEALNADAQLAAADVEMQTGQIAQAFARLLALLPDGDAELKERVRVRFIEYFDMVGPHDPRVAKARQRLALYLY
ncbi:MAG: tetratricopeptide repeat protein [Cellulomonadaceae bacterium]|jgi:putative thioredoxin|nr:tetratricopeptide repeat protein [Cellulomonadaceae bacterium]